MKKHYSAYFSHLCIYIPYLQVLLHVFSSKDEYVILTKCKKQSCFRFDFSFTYYNQLNESILLYKNLSKIVHFTMCRFLFLVISFFYLNLLSDKNNQKEYLWCHLNTFSFSPKPYVMI
jgi:hypothetical protein